MIIFTSSKKVFRNVWILGIVATTQTQKCRALCLWVAILETTTRTKLRQVVSHQLVPLFLRHFSSSPSHLVISDIPASPARIILQEFRMLMPFNSHAAIVWKFRITSQNLCVYESRCSLLRYKRNKLEINLFIAFLNTFLDNLLIY